MLHVSNGFFSTTSNISFACLNRIEVLKLPSGVVLASALWTGINLVDQTFYSLILPLSEEVSPLATIV